MDTTSVNHHRGKPRYHPRLSPEVVLTRAASPPYLVTPPAGATACLSSPDSDDIATPPGGNLRVSQYSTASDQERFYAAASSSSAESFETIATPWSRLSQVINPEVHPLTHNEVRASAMDPAMFSEDNHRAVRSWTARRGVKGSFWGTGSDSTTSPPIPTRSLPNAPARVSMRSQSPDSTYTASSSMSAAPRSSSESCVRSTPAARARVPSAPVRHYDDDHLLAPPAPSFTSGHPEVRPNSPDSFTTVTGSPNASPNASPRSGRLSLRLPRLRKTPSSTSLGESSPVARTRRLNALRNLVPNLNFVDQPWSVTDRGESEEIDDSQFWVPTEQPGNADEEEELAPQLDRLSLGSKFQVDAVCRLNQSTSSLPLAPTCTVTKSEKRRTLRNSRSMVSLKSIKPRLSDDDDNSRPVWRLRAASPSTSPPNSLPMDWTFPMPRKEASAPALSTNTSKHLTPDAVPKLARPITPGAHTRKQSSITRAQYVRELPRPLLKRKESFNIESSGYTKSINPLTPRPVLVPTTWRESLSEPGIYTHILIGPDGPNEVKRQEVMWEMGETEYAFLRACRSVNHLFANPLRHAGGWMPGIPTSVCDMFEALEVITYTHQDLSKAQQLDRRSADILDVSSFVAQFRAWVERLACHQPFVVLFNRVTKIIEDATRDPEGPFGAFVRMQMSDKALGSMTLGSMLLQPVQRLTKYPLFLKVSNNGVPSLTSSGSSMPHQWATQHTTTCSSFSRRPRASLTASRNARRAKMTSRPSAPSRTGSMACPLGSNWPSAAVAWWATRR